MKRLKLVLQSIMAWFDSAAQAYGENEKWWLDQITKDPDRAHAYYMSHRSPGTGTFL
jgi:uncharacterized damage-inducible protein DinB